MHINSLKQNLEGFEKYLHKVNNNKDQKFKDFINTNFLLCKCCLLHCHLFLSRIFF